MVKLRGMFAKLFLIPSDGFLKLYWLLFRIKTPQTNKQHKWKFSCDFYEKTQARYQLAYFRSLHFHYLWPQSAHVGNKTFNLVLSLLATYFILCNSLQ